MTFRPLPHGQFQQFSARVHGTPRCYQHQQLPHHRSLQVYLEPRKHQPLQPRHHSAWVQLTLWQHQHQHPHLQPHRPSLKRMVSHFNFQCFAPFAVLAPDHETLSFLLQLRILLTLHLPFIPCCGSMRSSFSLPIWNLSAETLQPDSKKPKLPAISYWLLRLCARGLF